MTDNIIKVVLFDSAIFLRATSLKGGIQLRVRTLYDPNAATEFGKRWDRLEEKGVCKELIMGKISLTEFCARLCKNDMSISKTQLNTAVEKYMGTIRPNMADLIKQIPKNVPIYVIGDGPRGLLTAIKKADPAFKRLRGELLSSKLKCSVLDAEFLPAAAETLQRALRTTPEEAVLVIKRNKKSGYLHKRDAAKNGFNHFLYFESLLTLENSLRDLGVIPA